MLSGVAFSNSSTTSFSFIKEMSHKRRQIILSTQNQLFFYLTESTHISRTGSVKQLCDLIEILLFSRSNGIILYNFKMMQRFRHTKKN